MSQETVEVVRKATDAVNRRDLDAFLAFLSPDVVWEVNPELPGLREVHRGRAEVRELIEGLFEIGESSHVAVEITDLSDDRVFAETVLTARGTGSGVPVELRYWQVLSVTEGKITNVHALPLIPVPAGPVAAAVDDALNGVDAEVRVARRPVLRQLRRAALDVEAVAFRPERDVGSESTLPTGLRSAGSTTSSAETWSNVAAVMGSSSTRKAPLTCGA